MGNWVFFQELLIAVFGESHSQDTELLAPVAQVVDSSDLVAGTLVQVGEKSTDNSGSQVTSVKRFGNVGRRELHYHLLAHTHGYAAVLLASGQSVLDHQAVQKGAIYVKLKEGPFVSDLAQVLVLVEGFGPFLGLLLGVDALQTQSGHRNNQVSLVQGGRSVQGIEDNWLVHVSELVQLVGDVVPDQVDDVLLRERVFDGLGLGQAQFLQAVADGGDAGHFVKSSKMNQTKFHENFL